MFFRPMIPIWLMACLCVGMLFLKRKGAFAYIRQIVIVLLLFIINLRPMFPGEAVTTGEKRTNIKVLFVIDDTISMLAEDCRGTNTRLDEVKKDCEYIVSQLSGASFGVVSFHNSTTILSPYTSNTRHIVNTISAIYPLDDFYARGSSLNTPKELTLSMLKRVREKEDDKIILFFISDGEITDGSTLESYSELKDYVDGGAVLGYGTKEGGHMHVESFYEDEPIELQDTSTYPYKPAVSRLDEENLMQIAGDVGIDYIHMADIDEIAPALEKIKNMETVVSSAGKTIKTKDIEGAREIYYYFAIPLLLLLAAEAVLAFVKKK
ncbi:MAG: VWA domain-containing protein [Clostridium sp.]|nr:VWA domain-containing protein [Clostridium sp.]